ncbi:hypothetical protein HY480_01040 [Candidatus Uhrbacteria bacterium]|nr:hypothetical protein [Candidatus Uhrbacteria bacterium]
MLVIEYWRLGIIVNSSSREQKAERKFLKRIVPFLDEIITSIPKGTRVYLVGGTLRNLFVYPYHPELKIKQRDYDLVVFGHFAQFKNNLVKKGFTAGMIQRQYQTVFKKPLLQDAKDLDDFAVLDIADASQLGVGKTGSVKTFLARKVNFTVNAMGVHVRDLKTSTWRKKVVFPFRERTMADLRAAQIRLNPKKRLFFPSDIYACVRFVSAGFLPPPRKELSLLKKAFINSPLSNLGVQRKKLFSYTNRRLVGAALKKMKLESIV